MSEKLTNADIEPQILADALRLTSGNSFVTSGQIKVMEMAANMLESLTAERDELREVIRYCFSYNPDTGDGCDAIAHELLPMPDAIRQTIIAECKAAI